MYALSDFQVKKAGRICRPFFVKKQRNKEKGVFGEIPKTPDSLDFIGAGARIRTAGFLITSELLLLVISDT
ncbi:hypothetical protein [uncultured Desulfobacter sp.]|uniref:hypothetical protein n=1 Tax=uncultured Desulfobacter sp. TaxID=240139 RepID=UPI0029F5185A|nr:hypothetical protein [uncultured Desulfobacter sp.]